MVGDTARKLSVGMALLFLITCGTRVSAEVLLNEIVGGGDGKPGSAPPENVGISADDGTFRQAHQNGDIANSGDNPQNVSGVTLNDGTEGSEFIDSVFIMDVDEIAINSAGVTFSFNPGDSNGSTWNHIIKDLTHDIDKGLGDIYFGCQAFRKAIGLHASAGITFDLDAIRESAVDPSEVDYFTGYLGKDRCAGNINVYVIFSDESEIIDSFMSSYQGPAQGEPVQLVVPPEAKFMTLAVGDRNDGIGCDHGVFAEPRLSKAPPVEVARDIPGFSAGASAEVLLEMSILSATNSVEVREVIPAAFTASSPNEGGVIEELPSPGRQTIVWKFSGADVTSKTLSYTIQIPNPYPNSCIKSSSVIADGTSFFIYGDTGFSGGSDGFAMEALVINMFQSGGDSPGDTAIRRDYLTDGDAVNELTVTPVQGESVSPDFNGESPGTGPTAVGSTTWSRLTGPGWFQLNTCDQCMSYVAFYVDQERDVPVRLTVGSSSDDSEQILIDGKEVWIHNIGRGAAGAIVQDTSAPFDLAPGKHLVLQKVFEGGGGHDSAIRFQDEDGNPYLMPFSLDPSGYPVGTAFVVRDIASTLDVGESGKVSLKVRVRAPTDGLIIEENVPANFTISNITGGGVQAGQKITWTQTGPLSTQDLSYTVAVPASSLDAAFQGSATLGGKPGPILGDQAFDRGIMTSTGFIKQWLVLGPLDTFGVWFGDPANPNVNPDSPSATPENGDLRADFLAGGGLTEANIRPFDGMRINPSFGAESKAVGLDPVFNLCAPEQATWERYITPSGTFNHDDYFGGGVDSHATYAAVYITNTTGVPIVTNVAIDSDDAFIAFLDGTEIVAYEPGPCSATACGRGMMAEPGTPNVAAVTILPGEHFLLTRVHDGAGGSGHRLRFQDAAGNPLLPPALGVSLRSQGIPPDVHVTRTLSSETYRVGGAPITVTLQILSSGNHSVAIKEVLPLGWSAGNISDGGSEAAGSVNWNLPGVSGAQSVSYTLVPGDCPGGGSFCGNGTAGSSYTVNGAATHALNGDSTFRRETRGTDDLGVWDVRDIGYIGGGTQRVDEHGADVSGRGAGVRGLRDEFRFVSVPANGDFEISARIECLDDPSLLGQGGLMVRDTFDTFSAHAFLSIASADPASGSAAVIKATLRRQTKATQNSSTVNIADNDVPALPIWLRLKRAGTKITFHRSNDGAGYTEIGSRDIGTTSAQINLKTDTLIGLAVSGFGGSTRADYRDIQGQEGGVDLPPFTSVTPNAPTLTQATGGDGKVSLAWNAPATGPAPSAYVVLRAGGPGGPYSQVAEVAGTSHEDGGLAASTQYCYVVRSKIGQSESVNSNEMCATTTGGGAPSFKRGDVDGNGVIDISDPVGLLGSLFLGAGDPACLEAADFDDGGAVDITDAVNNLGYQFLGTAAPAAPGPLVCGKDPAGTFLGCPQGGCP